MTMVHNKQKIPMWSGHINLFEWKLQKLVLIVINTVFFLLVNVSKMIAYKLNTYTLNHIPYGLMANNLKGFGIVILVFMIPYIYKFVHLLKFIL